MRRTKSTNETEQGPLVQSTSALIRAIFFAALIAGFVLVLLILPAEYGVDPTGIGRALGLTRLADTELLATPTDSQTIVSQAKDSQVKQDLEFREDSTKITVPPGKGLEYKFHITSGDAMRYNWTSSGELFFDFHGEPDGDTSGYFQSYAVSSTDKIRGTFTASFDGSHGWYWKNKGQTPIVVTLETEGTYKIIGIK